VEALRGERNDFAAVLQACSSAVILVDKDANVLFANAAAEAAAARGALSFVDRTLGLGDPRQTLALRQLIGAVATSGPPAAGGTLRVGPGPLQAVVTPVRSDRIRVFMSRASAVVWLMDLGSPIAPSAAALRQIFALSPAEIQVALALTEGLTADAAAVRLNKSVHTVRAHIRQILQKTGARRLSDLASLLARTGAQGPATLL
jgi:DNA-binding CsgD family transcriptional regulator